MKLDTANVATILVLVYAIVGALVVVLSVLGHVDAEVRLTFNQYLESMAIAAGGLAVGRGLAARKVGR